MIAFEQAQEIVQRQCARLPDETVPLQALPGRVTANSIRSPVDLPGFDNSAMDGFALRLEGRAADAGTLYTVTGEQAAGDCTVGSRSDADCWSIMTGAQVPQGFDTVVPVEQVEILEWTADGRPLRIRLRDGASPNQHIRRAGEDIALGDVALPGSTFIDAPALMLLAGLGVASARVVRRPRIALICTGRELVDDPVQALAPGQIRNSNAAFLAARIPACGAELVHRETVPDEPALFEAALARARAADADIVISTGAVSMGRFDFVPAVLDRVGAVTLFHKVAMRPGKPLLFAKLPNGALYFGLPGNPVSSVVGFRFFVEAALRTMLGLGREQPWRLPLAHDASKKPGFRLHQKARLQLGSTGRLHVHLLQGQESFKTRPLIEARVWAALPADVSKLGRGDNVDVFPLGHELGVRLGAQHDEEASCALN